MSLTTTSIIILGLYFLVLLAITYFAGRKENTSDFSIGSRKIGLWQTTASISAGFRDGAGVIVWGSLSIFFGLHTMWFFVALSLALVLLSLTAKKVRQKAQEVGAVTQGDYLKAVIGSKTALVSSVVVMITAFLYAASQLTISGAIFSVLLNISTTIGILITIIAVAIYLIVGGYKTVVKTDMFQWLIILVILVVPFILATKTTGELPLLGAIPLDIPLIVGASLVSFFGVYSYADVWQRIFSAKDEKTAKNSLLLSIPVYFLISLGLVFLGIFSGMLVGETVSATPLLDLFTIQTISPILLVIIGVFTLASMMSTFDTQVFLFAQTISRNLIKNQSEKRHILNTRIIVLITLILLAVLAATVTDIIQFVFSAFTLITVLAPVLFFQAVGWLENIENVDKKISIILTLSAVIYFIMFFTGMFANILLLSVPALLSLVGVIICLIKPKI